MLWELIWSAQQGSSNKDPFPFSYWINAMPIPSFLPIKLLDPGCWYKFTYQMANSVDPDQLAASEASWSGSTLFAKAGHIRVQQD